MKFRIGSEDMGYIYSETDMELDGYPVYKCCRGNTKNQDVLVLWLSREEDGHWVAYENRKDSKEPLEDGTKVFRTTHVIDDISMPGKIEWEQFVTRTNSWKAFTYPFKTVRVDE